MFHRLAADAVLVLHLGFIAFVVLGAVLVLRWHRLAWVHLPAAAWGCFVELTGRICPLTYWENALRAAAGEAGYTGSFIEHYLLPVIYPAGLTRDLQYVLAAAVVIVNVVLYGRLLVSLKRARAGTRRTRQPPLA